MILTVIGIGLIGGSMAMELKQKKFLPLCVDSNVNHQKIALDKKIVDEIHSLEQAIKMSDIVLISIPVDNTSKVLKEVLDLVDKQIVLDVGSIKEKVTQHVNSHPKRKNFVATHPIAGTEFSGPKAAHLGLFKGKLISFEQRRIK